MELKDVMYVTYEMMDYLIGDRENLDAYTVSREEKSRTFLMSRTNCIWLM